jgi:heme-degrading monooxygenase HmoA
MHGMQVTKQSKTQKGFIKMKNTGFGYMHYTLSAWETKEDVKNFAKSGAHLEAMKESAAISKQIATYTYETDKMPDWVEAKKLLKEKGKVLKF